MIPALIAVTLIGWLQAPTQPRVSCSVQAPSVVSRSASGVAQVGNLQLIPMECRRFARRPMPPSGQQHLLAVEAVVFQLGEAGQRTLVPSKVNPSGGGIDLEAEYVSFYLDIPIDDVERDAVAREILAELGRRAVSSTNEVERAAAANLQGTDPRGLAQMVRQHRTGRFQVEFRMLDEGRLAGDGTFGLEVIDQGSFFDLLLRSK